MVEPNIPKEITKTVKSTILDDFMKYVDEIKLQATEIYKDLLFGTVYEDDSLSSPENFYELYVERVDNFEYLNEDTPFTLEIPNNDTFDFSDGLGILQLIVEGVVGDFFELPEMLLQEVYSSKRIDNEDIAYLNNLPGNISDNVLPELQFRLIPTDDYLVDTIQNIVDRDLVLFPFSNSTPVPIFDELEQFVKDKLDTWISDTISSSLTSFADKY